MSEMGILLMVECNREEPRLFRRMHDPLRRIITDRGGIHGCRVCPLRVGHRSGEQAAIEAGQTHSTLELSDPDGRTTRMY